MTDFVSIQPEPAPATPMDAARMAGEAQFTQADAEALIGRALTPEEDKAYQLAVLTSELSIRRAVIATAVLGSPPAQTLALGFIESRRARDRGRAPR